MKENNVTELANTKEKLLKAILNQISEQIKYSSIGVPIQDREIKSLKNLIDIL